MAAAIRSLVMETSGDYRTAGGDQTSQGGRDQQATQEPAAPLPAMMAGWANAVKEQLVRAGLGGVDFRFLQLVERQTFGMAGRHRRDGREDPGLWCHFDLPAWAGILALPKPNVLRARGRLVTLGLLWYEADLERPGEGRLGWNLRFEQWLATDPEYIRKRYSRPGAGRPRKVREEAGITSLNTGDQAGVISLNTGQYGQASVITLNNSEQAGVITLNKNGVFKVITDGSLDAGTGAAPRDPPIRVTKKIQKEDPERLYESPSPSGLEARGRGRTDTCARTREGEASLGLVADEDPFAVGLSGGTLTAKTVRPPQRSAEPDPPSSAAPPQAAGGHGRTYTPEQTYRAELIAAVAAARGAGTTNKGRDWKAAGWFYRDAPGAPVAADEVVACYAAESGRPRWDTATLTLFDIQAVFVAWRRNPANFAAGIARARRAANGDYDAGVRAARGAPAHRPFADGASGSTSYWTARRAAREGGHHESTR